MGIFNKQLTASVENLLGNVKDKDTQGFVDRMNELKKYIGK